MRVIGLMSGTSADGVDAVLVNFRGNPNKPIWSMDNSAFIEYPKSIREKVILVSQGLKFSSQEWVELSEEITELYAFAALSCDPKKTAEIVGCHGQTLWHCSPAENQRGGSLQMVQAALLASLVERPVVFDFRSKDIAIGGHGAPLVPLVDEAIIGRINGWRAVLNLGGIANLTFIPPKRGPDRLSSVIGWDCGPANTLIDFAVQMKTNGDLDFDRNGKIAEKGFPNLEIIDKWIKEPFFLKTPPKSTGREEFGILDLKRRIDELGSESLEDILSTLTTFTAAIVSQDLYNFSLEKNVNPVELLVSGGGSKNDFLISQIVKKNRGVMVKDIAEIGINSQLREALAFATLAWWNVLRKPVFGAGVTGSRKKVILGIYVDKP